MNETVTPFEGSEGNRLAASVWNTAGEAKGSAVLLHGGGQTRHAWDRAGRRLSGAGFETYALDARGHGESEWVPSKRYSMFDMAADLGCVLCEVRRRTHHEPIVIGASMGGLATMLHCAEQSDIGAKAIVLVDITPRMRADGVDRIMSFMAEKAEDGFESVEQAADAIASYLPDRPRPKSLKGLAKNLRRHGDGRYRWHWDPNFVSGPHPVESREGPVRQKMLYEGVARMKVPLLLIRGARSELVDDEAVREVLTLAPHAKFVDVGGAGHMVAGDRNDAFNDALIEFVERLC